MKYQIASPAVAGTDASSFTGPPRTFLHHDQTRSGLSAGLSRAVSTGTLAAVAQQPMTAGDPWSGLYSGSSSVTALA